MAADAWTPLPVDPTQRRRALWLALSGHLLSRLGYHAAGIRFDESPLGSYWQFIDPALLRTRLLESVLYLHGQPPLFNLFLGGVLKLFPGAHAAAFHLLYLGFGLGLTAAILSLGVRLGLRPYVAGGLALLFAVSPPAALFESWLFYTCPVALLLCLSAVALHRFAERRRARDAALFFGLLAAIVLTRSLFHLGWLLLALGGVLWLLPARREALRGFSLPFGLCLAVYLKNLALFGFFGTSSWLGFSVARVVTASLPDAQALAWIHEGKLSSFALVAPFGDLSDYKHLRAFSPGAPTGIPVLDQEVRSTGVNNFHHRAYLELPKRYLEDARRVIRLAPGAVAIGWSHALYHFLRPASEYHFLKPNLDRIAKFERLFDGVVFGQLHPQGAPARDAPVPLASYAREGGWWILAAWLAALVGGGLLLRERLRGPAAGDPFTVTWAFLWLTVLWVAAVGNLLEVEENNRFRYLADPLVLVMVAVLVSGWRRARAARGGARA